MQRQTWRNYTPPLLVALGIVAASYLAVRAGAGWQTLAAPLVLAAAVIAADLLESRLRGRHPQPTPGALILAPSFLLACLTVGIGDPQAIKDLMPTLGVVASMTVLVSPARRCRRAAPSR